jgi:two-component system, OmpR family, sensor kinase
MASTRARFTVSYVTLAMLAVIAFALAVWSGRQAVARDQLVAQAQSYADGLLADLRGSQASGFPLTVVDSSAPGFIKLSRDLRSYLDQKPGYFVLIGPKDQVLYNSALIRMLAPTDGDSLLQYAVRLKPTELALVPLTADSTNKHRLAIRGRSAGPALEPGINRIIVGLPDQDVELSGQLLMGTMIVMFPFILLACTGAAYFMAGRVFKPMHDLTNQLEAITDGRSLHRRLPPDIENDELGRMVTTLNAMLSRLEVSFGALRRFTADASHELKTPLAVLRADVERAMHPHTAREDRLVALEESLQEVTRMSDLVDSLLTLARADEGRFELALETVHIEPLLRDVYETATILGESGGLSIAMPTLDDAVVLGERTRLRQLLLNLITNAIKYTPRGGRVELSSTLRGPHEVVIAVRDTGIGISATDLPHIFDRFWRADRARSRVAERSGFGLGLAISQYIAQAHGGALIAQSRLGRGTLFTVVLPIVVHAAEASDQALPMESPTHPETATTAPRTADSHSDFTES